MDGDQKLTFCVSHHLKDECVLTASLNIALPVAIKLWHEIERFFEFQLAGRNEIAGINLLDFSKESLATIIKALAEFTGTEALYRSRFYLVFSLSAKNYPKK